MSNVQKQMEDVNKTMKASVKSMDNAASHISTKQLETLSKSIANLEKAVKSIDVQAPEMDMSPLNTLNSSMREMIGYVKKTDTTNMENRFENSLSNLKLRVPDTFKIDSQQMRELSAARFSSGGSGGGGAPSQEAESIQIANVTMTSADTEYSYTFPANTVGFYMKLRSQGEQFTYSWETGKLPGSGDASAYATTPYNFLQSRTGVNFSNKTIYFESATASQVMEIEIHTLT